MKMFVLGRPGSGKTTAFHYISQILENKGWSVTRIRDYNILRKMFQEDKEHKQFHPTQHDGFDVTDFSVLDKALEEVERVMEQLHTHTQTQKRLIMAEFARDDYEKALTLFSENFLADTHILFVDADVETCMQRIRNRVLHGKTADDHFVSEVILTNYYGRDNTPYMFGLAKYNKEACQAGYPVRHVIQAIKNTDRLDDFHRQIDCFITTLLEHDREHNVKKTSKQQRKDNGSVKKRLLRIQRVGEARRMVDRV